MSAEVPLTLGTLEGRPMTIVSLRTSPWLNTESAAYENRRLSETQSTSWYRGESNQSSDRLELTPAASQLCRGFTSDTPELYLEGGLDMPTLCLNSPLAASPLS